MEEDLVQPGTECSERRCDHLVSSEASKNYSYHVDIFALKKAWLENGGSWTDQEVRAIEARELARRHRGER